MAQLLKVGNCISRYEEDLFHYASHFLNIKKRRWETFLNGDEATSEHKRTFREGLFKYQLIWATSTRNKKSTPRTSLINNKELLFLLSGFMDTSLLMYQPHFKVGGSVIEADTVLVSPNEVLCIKTLSGEQGSVFEGGSKGRWHEIVNEGTKTYENPVNEMNRMMKVVRTVTRDLDAPPAIRGLLVAPESYIEFNHLFLNSEVIDKRQIHSWLKQRSDRKQAMRHKQLLWAGQLLKATESIAVRR